MKVVKIILWLIVLGIVLFVAYIVFSFSQIRKGEVRDLGVRYTMADYDRAVSTKGGVELIKDRHELYLGSNFMSEGEKRIDQSFTDAEISAIQNYSNDTKGPMKNVQIHFLGNNEVEASAFISDPQVNAPAYVKATVTQTGPKSFSIKGEQLVIGNATIPTLLRNQAEKQFNKEINKILTDIPSLNIEKVEINNGSVHFVGTIPAKIE